MNEGLLILLVWTGIVLFFVLAMFFTKPEYRWRNGITEVRHWKFGKWESLKDPTEKDNEAK